MAKSSEAKKCYDIGALAESAQLCAMLHDDSEICLRTLRQMMEPLKPEVPNSYLACLTGQSQAPSGTSSMDGSSIENTPPYMYTGVSPASLKVLSPIYIVDL